MSSQDKIHRGGAERILDAAMLLFGERGFRGTTMKDIATEAGVSQALIVHHYGSKEDLRAACDEHVAHLIRTRKEEAIGSEPQIDPFIALRQMSNSRVLLRYLTRALTEGGPHAAQLIDDMIADAEEYMVQGEKNRHDQTQCCTTRSSSGLGALVAGRAGPPRTRAATPGCGFSRRRRLLGRSPTLSLPRYRTVYPGTYRRRGRRRPCSVPRSQGHHTRRSVRH